MTRIFKALSLSSLLFSVSVYAQPLEVAAFPAEVITRPAEKPPGPAWMHKACFYQVYPQTFMDSDGDGTGDLKGIISKLDYIKSLGVDAIWLNPFFVSPFRDAGYDISDYYHVAPRYGTDQDAKDLFRIAKEKGLRIIIDFVAGHTSIDHPWFKASASPEKNKYSNWYIWTSSTWMPGMTNYKGDFIQGYSDRDGNYMINFFWHQPALNYGWGKIDPSQKWQLPVDHPDVLALRAEMKKVVTYWLDMGSSGFRADMAGSLVKNDTGSQIRYFWQDIRKTLDEQYPDAFMVSEWSAPDAAISAGFHSDFMHWFKGYRDLFENETVRNPSSAGHSFFDREGKGNISAFLGIYQKEYAAIRGRGYISLPVGNHDLIRINNNGRSRKDLEIIQVFNFTMPNIPFIYYGDEIGMKQLSGIRPKEGAYQQRAGARTPMQWSRAHNAGFSAGPAGKLYFPVDTSLDAPDVASQQKDPGSMLNFIKTLVRLHKEEPALANYASFTPVYAKTDTYPFIYLRSDGKDNIVVLLNPSSKAVSAEIKGEISGDRRVLLGDKPGWKAGKGKTVISMEGCSFSIVKIINPDKNK